MSGVRIHNQLIATMSVIIIILLSASSVQCIVSLLAESLATDVYYQWCGGLPSLN